MNQKQFNERCHKVFLGNAEDEYYSIDLVGEEVVIQMSEQEDNCCVFNYKPDMSDRPEALVYLLGQRNNFND